MFLVGIDIGKNSHFFCIVNSSDGEIFTESTQFKNNQEGFDILFNSLKEYPKSSILIGMEDTGHYHFTLLKLLLDQKFTVALINPTTTNLTRRLQGGITKNDKLDALTICDVLSF